MNAVFVTGAASGIGLATAERFAAEGWLVAVSDVDGDGARAAAARLGDQGVPVPLDVRDFVAFEAAVRGFVSRAGRLDAIVNNAGVCDVGFFEEVPVEKTRRIVDVNLVGVIHGMYAAIPHLEPTKGTIVNIASLSAAYGVPHLAVYSATKHAVVGLTEAVEIELRRKGVRAVAICPPFVETPILDSPRHSAGPDVPTRRLQPGEVAAEVWAAVQGGGVLRFPGSGTAAFYRLCRAFPGLARFVMASQAR